MEFPLVILDLIKRLKSKKIQVDEKIQGSIKFIPLDIIQSLLHRLNFIKAEIALNAIESRSLLVRKIKGCPSIYNNIYVYNFKMSYTRHLKNDEIEVGNFIIYSPSKLGQEEYSSLEVFTILIGENIGNKLYNSSLSRINRTCSQISNDVNYTRNKTENFEKISTENLYDYNYLHKRTSYSVNAGSLVFSLVKHIHLSTRCFASYFGIINNDIFHIDYIQSKYQRKNIGSNNRLLLKKNKAYFLQKRFIKSCNHFEITSHSYKEIFSESCEVSCSKISFFFVTLVIKHDGIPICLFLIQIDSDKVFFFDSCKILLNHINTLDLKEFRYLFQRRTKKMIVEPYYSSRETRVDEKKVFVLMPFDEKWSDRIWKRYIKPTVEKIGLIAERADDLYGKDIMEDVWKGILSAKVIIADITGRNPNVFYELGISHTIGKDVIIITQCIDDIPVDLKRYRCIKYEDNADGYEKLEMELLKHLASRIGNTPLT